MEFNVAVIGAGALGTQHAKVWHDRDDAKVAGVFDPDGERCEKLAKEVEAKACGSHEEAIGLDGVNVVSVATPVCFHAEVSIHALERGCHVLTEKPIALTLEQADAMIAAAKKADRHLGVSYQYRGNPAFARVRELFRSGLYGGPVFARFQDIREVRPKLAMHRKSMNGGPVIDMAGHWFDLMRWWTGEEAVRVYARGHVYGRGKPRLETVEDFAIDAAEVTVEMGGGHVLAACVNWGMPEAFPALGHHLICGPDAATWIEEDVIVQHPDRKVLYQKTPPPPGPTARIEDLVAAIRGEKPLEVSGEEGRKALRICLAALESIETDRAVELD